MSTNEEKEFIIVGRFGAPFGINGSVKLYSDTVPKDNIFNYQPWTIKTARGYQTIECLEGRRQGKELVVTLKDCHDREMAKDYTNLTIAVPREQLPELDKTEYYWRDLEGLAVNTKEGLQLGTVDHLLETGANDVLVIKGEREHLIPFILEQTILNVDLQQKTIMVDWDPNF